MSLKSIWGSHETLQEKLDGIKPINVTSYRQCASANAAVFRCIPANLWATSLFRLYHCQKMKCNCGRTMGRNYYLTEMCSEATLYYCSCWMSNIIIWSAINVRCLCSGFEKRKKENPFQIHEIDNIASMWQWICHTRIVNKENEVEKPFHDGFQTFPEDISQPV